MGKIKNGTHACKTASQDVLRGLAGQEPGGAHMPSRSHAALRTATECARQIESAARDMEEAATRLVDALETARAATASSEAATPATRTLVAPQPPESVRPQPTPLRLPPMEISLGETKLAPSREIEAAVKQLLCKALEMAPAPVTPEKAAALEAMRAALDETTRLNAMYIAFIDTALGRLDVLEERLRDPGGHLNGAVTAAYPLYVCNRFKQAHVRLRRCKTSALIYRSMLSTDRRSLGAGKTYLEETTKPLALLMPYVSEHELPRVLQQTYSRLSAFMQVVARDLLCEDLVAYWCVDLQRESRRLLPTIVDLQLNLLEPFVDDVTRSERIRIPNLDHFVEAAAVTRRRPLRSGTLAGHIAASGARLVQQHAEAARARESEGQHRLETASCERLARQYAARMDIGGDVEGSSHMFSGSASDSEEEDLYARCPEPNIPTWAPPRHDRKPRRLRFAKQTSQEEAGPSAAPQPDTGTLMGRHKAKHRSERRRANHSNTGDTGASDASAVAPGGVAGSSTQAPAPDVKLGRRAADTLRRLMAPSYREKVKRDEYLQLLNDFAEQNGPQGTGYLKRVRQASSDNGAGTAGGPLRFNGSHESIWFQRHDDQWVLHSFHYPHGRESHVELPKGMLHDYRNVFKAFGITSPSPL